MMYDIDQSYRQQTQTLAVVLGLAWSASAGVLVYIARLPVPDHALAISAWDILRTIAMAWAAILLVPTASRFFANSFKAAVAAQAAFWGLFLLLWLVGPVQQPAFDSVVMIGVLAGLASFLRHTTWNPVMVFVVAVVGIIFAFYHITYSMMTGYAQPLALEAALIGAQHRDTLFHAALAGSIMENGVISAGLDGIVPMGYHVLSHRIVGALSVWIGTAPLNGFSLFVPIIGGPLIFFQFLWASAELSKGPRGGLTAGLALIGLAAWLVFLSDVIIGPYWVSETYMVSLWALLGAVSIMATTIGKCENSVFLGIALGMLVLLACLSKISTGAVMACGVAAFLWAYTGFGLRGMIAGVVFGMVPFVATMILAPVDSGHADGSIIAPLASLLKYTRPMILHYGVVVVLLCIALITLRRRSETGPIVLSIVTIMCAGVGASLLVHLDGASTLYFINPAIWVGFCLLPLSQLAPVWVHKCPKRYKPLLVTAGLALTIYMAENLVKGPLTQDRTTARIAHFQTDTSHGGYLDALPIGKIVLAAQEADGVFIAPEAEEFWNITPRCWAVALAVPAITTTPLLMGRPAPETGCFPNQYYGFGELDPSRSTQRVMQDEALCAEAAKRSMTVVTVVEADLHTRKVTCGH